VWLTHQKCRNILYTMWKCVNCDIFWSVHSFFTVHEYAKIQTSTEGLIATCKVVFFCDSMNYIHYSVPLWYYTSVMKHALPAWICNILISLKIAAELSCMSTCAICSSPYLYFCNKPWAILASEFTTEQLDKHNSEQHSLHYIQYI